MHRLHWSNHELTASHGALTKRLRGPMPQKEDSKESKNNAWRFVFERKETGAESQREKNAKGM